MALVKSKGTIWKVTIASVLTAIAQVIGLDLPESEGETFEADTLDNTSAGIPYEPTGRSEWGSFGGEMFLDPALASHKALLALTTTPAKNAMSFTFADAGATVWPFTCAGFKIGATVDLKDGLKAKIGGKLSGLPTYP